MARSNDLAKMSLWTFHDYETESGENHIRSWYDAQAVAAQAAFRAAVIQLGRRPQWGPPLFKDLKKAHAGLSEIRFSIGVKPGLRRFRPVGICDPLHRDFVFLVGCEKFEHGRTEPEMAFDLALDLKSQLDQGKGTIRAHQYS